MANTVNRQYLGILTALVAGIGIVCLAVLFALALAPSERARQSRPSVDTSNLQPGSYVVRPFLEGSSASVVFLKKWTGEFRAFIVPVEDEKVVMPDVHWWHSSGYACTEFRPDLDSNGRLHQDGVIRCHDPEVPQWWSEQWLWDYDGKPKGGRYAEAMHALKIEVDGDTAWLYF